MKLTPCPGPPRLSVLFVLPSFVLPAIQYDWAEYSVFSSPFFLIRIVAPPLNRVTPPHYLIFLSIARFLAGYSAPLPSHERCRSHLRQASSWLNDPPFSRSCLSPLQFRFFFFEQIVAASLRIHPNSAWNLCDKSRPLTTLTFVRSLSLELFFFSSDVGRALPGGRRT